MRRYINGYMDGSEDMCHIMHLVCAQVIIIVLCFLSGDLRIWVHFFEKCCRVGRQARIRYNEYLCTIHKRRIQRTLSGCPSVTFSAGTSGLLRGPGDTVSPLPSPGTSPDTGR